MANEIVKAELATPVNREVPAADSAVGDYVPAGWDDVESFLDYVRKEFDADITFDRENRDEALEDLEFIAGEQWDRAVKASREAKGRPCLTINVLPQFIGQVIGDRRLNRTSIKVSAMKNGTAQVAEVRSGLIKAIEAQSRAERVYDAACEDQVSCGISNFRIDLDYASNDVFEQDIFVRHIPNPLAVVWDRLSIDPTGRDARHCFVTDNLPRNVYDKRFPDHPSPSSLEDGVSAASGWVENDFVRITEFWELIDKPVTLAMMADGDVKDITGRDINELAEQIMQDPVSGKPRIRKTTRSYARMHLVSGFALLSEAYELPIERLPIIRVEGRVIRLADKRVRYGLVRYAKDSQRLKNYWRSTAAETIALAPKAQFVADEASVEGREDEWRDANKSGDMLLIFNKNTDRPERLSPPAVPAALLQEAQMNQQDIKDTTGLHDASLGIRSNEVSGKAIQARQREGDVATIIYHDNLNAAIQEGGDVINQLIPLAYDTLRTVRVIGLDDKDKMMTINDPNDENSPDITAGKYDVRLNTGPSFTTQRLEAQDAMMALIQTAPQLMTVIGDLVAESMDWPGAHEIAERLRKTMPKEIVGDEEEGMEAQQPSEEEMAAQAQMQEAQQAQMQMQQMQMADAQAQLEHAAAMRQVELAEAKLKLAQSEADAISAEAASVRASADAERARADAEKAKAEAAMAPIMLQQKMRMAETAASAKLVAQQRGTGSRPVGDRSKQRNQRKNNEQA